MHKALKGFKFRTIKNAKIDYCPACRKRREHVKISGIKLCKTCGYQEKVLKIRI